MATIRYDNTTGTFSKDEVWQFLPPSMDDDNSSLWVYGETSRFEAEKVHTCANDPTHVTAIVIKDVAVDLFSGQLVGDFVPVPDYGCTIITEQFAKRLQGSELTGLRIRPIVRVAVNQSAGHVGNLQLLEGDLIGRDRRWEVVGADNLCPFCRLAPVVCPYCGEFNRICPSCSEGTLVGPNVGLATGDPRLQIEAFPETYVVESMDWNGADWFRLSGSGVFVSRRAKEWLERSGAQPCLLRPALLSSS